MPLSAAEFSLLWACREAPAEGLAQTALAAALAVSPAQVSGLVERLRSRHLLEHHRCSQDRRRQLWRLTPEGRAALSEAAAELLHRADCLEDELPADDSQRLLAMLNRLVDLLGRGARSPASGRLVRLCDDTPRRCARQKGAA